MATYLKIADNDMNYFQYKARQMLLLKREDREWKDFCKQVAPECAACLAEETESRDIGIQAFPEKPMNEMRRTLFESKHKNEKIPEALNDIKSRLEKIDLALTKIHDVTSDNEKRKPEAVVPFDPENTLKSFETQRKLLIQNSLRSSLQKLHNSLSRNPEKPSPALKVKNLSYFLPHDLQVKRAAARKAYLASLQTKPKVSFQNVNRMSKKITSSNSNIKAAPKQALKSKKKVLTKKSSKESNTEKEETQITAVEADAIKDDSTEHVVDGILDDLLKEAALDLNRIRQRKKEGNSCISCIGSFTNKEKNTVVHSLSSTQNNEMNIPENESDKSITNLKSFFDFPKKPNLKTEHSEKVFVDRSTNTCLIQSKSAPKRNVADDLWLKKTTEIERNPMFECGVAHVIAIDSESAKDILENKNRFWKYLKRISRTAKGNFNPWVLNKMLAESILDECIEDIAKELKEMPANVIQDLYNQEFIQQVTD